jgi:hypothetical protein
LVHGDTEDIDLPEGIKMLPELTATHYSGESPMTLSIRPEKPDATNQAKPFRHLFFNARFIEALTPAFLALLGGIIGVTVSFTTESDAGFSLASTAIAGAAGLAQSNRDTKDSD